MPRLSEALGPERRPLAACVALTVAQAFTTVSATPPHRPQTPQTWTVLNCGDSGADSLRDIITNTNSPHYAHSGDTVDLSQLPMLCGGMADSTITLTSGEIAISQTDLTLLGPTPHQGSATISGGGAQRVFRHTTNGTLSIHNLKIIDGYYHAASNADGGCIDGAGGSIYLRSVTVTHCTALSDTGYATGGGVRNLGGVTLVLSDVSGNQALAPMKRGFGGGVLASNLIAKYSSISDNVAGDGISGGWGGGAYALAGISMVGSTVDNNTASYGGGLELRATASIINSTISGNTAHHVCAALLSSGSDSLDMLNSTIAFNQDETADYGAVCFSGMSGNSVFTLQSSIIANNTAVGPMDLVVNVGTLAGADNLVMASNVVDSMVIPLTVDPKLGPLQFNGGRTRTHALLAGSPAIGAGDPDALPAGYINDQRGFGYPRTTDSGANVTTDIGAIQFDRIFNNGFDP